jgi:hypothetical protein
MNSEDFERIAIVTERGQLCIRRDAHGIEPAGRSFSIPHMRGMDAAEALRLAGQLEQAAAATAAGQDYSTDHAYELGVSVDPRRQIWVWGRTGPSRRFIPVRDLVTDEGLTVEQARVLVGRIRAAAERLSS